MVGSAPSMNPSPANLAVRNGSSTADAKDPEILFKEGDIVCEYVPYVWTVLPEFVSLHCYRCGLNPDPLKPKRCSGCQHAHYCSEECQTADWKDRHKMECKILRHPIIAALPGCNRASWILTYAAIARLAEETMKNDGVKATLHLTVDMKAAAGSLGYLGSSIGSRSIVHYFQDLFNLCDPKRVFIERDLELGATTFMMVYGAMMQFPLPLMGQIGNSPENDRDSARIIGQQLPVAVTPPFREVLRGCVTNVLVRHEIWHRNAPKSMVRAVKDIREGDPLMGGLEPRFSTWKSRKAYMASMGMATCGCKACTDPAFQAGQCALKCQNVKCYQAIPYDGRAKQPCLACGTDNSQRLKEAKAVIDDISKWLDIPEGRTALADNHFLPSDKVIPQPNIMRQQIIRGLELLHPTNLLLGKACFDYCDWLRNSNKEDSPDYIPFLKRVIPSIEVHSNKYDYVTRNLYSDIVRAHVKRKEYGDAQPYMDTLAKRLELVTPKTQELTRLKLQIVNAATALLRTPKPNDKLIFKALEETSMGRSPKIYRMLE